MVNVLRQRAPDLLMTPLQETGQPLDGTEVAGLFQDVVPLSTQQACDLFCEHQRLQGHFAGKCVTRQILLQHDLAAMECYEDMMTTPHWIVEAKSIVWARCLSMPITSGRAVCPIAVRHGAMARSTSGHCRA